MVRERGISKTTEVWTAQRFRFWRACAQGKNVGFFIFSFTKSVYQKIIAKLSVIFLYFCVSEMLAYSNRFHRVKTHNGKRIGVKNFYKLSSSFHLP